MPPPRKKAKLETMRCPKNPVCFEQFKKLIENLPDISFDVQRDGVAGKGVLTLDECAFWYYESFYKNPEIRLKYPYKLRACPMGIRVKLLSMPESEPVGEPAAEQQTAKDVMVKVARMGTFIFPVTFFEFKKHVDAEKVLRMMGMSKEDRKAMLADGSQCEVILKKFYNSFYMFPDRQSTDIFKKVSLQLLAGLLKHGEPYDELAKNSVEKHAAGKKRQTSVVSFEVFEKYATNMFDIVWQLKLHDRDYAALDFDKCARALYLAFYLKPEIRDRYMFKWRPCSLAMQKRLLSIPNGEAAEELRKSFQQLIPDSPNEEDIEAIEVEVVDEYLSAADNLRLLENNNNNNSFEKQLNLNQPAMESAKPESSEELPKLVLIDSSEGSLEALFQTDVEVEIAQSGRFLFPVSFDTYRRCINYAEIIRPILTLALKDAFQIEDLIPHPRNPICEKIFLRFYRSFYIFPDTRQKCEYRFSCKNSQVLKKLTEYAKPLDESAIKTMDDAKTKCQEATNSVPVEQSKKKQAEGAAIVTVLGQEGQQKMENTENAKDKKIRENIENSLNDKAKKVPNLPVTFHAFKRYVTNFNEILQQMKQCDEYKEKSDTECAEEYYKGFYTSPEMRNKFKCIMRPCPAKMRDVLLSYAKQPVSLDSSGESNCVCLADVLPTARNVATLSEDSKGIPVKESKVNKTHENHVSFHLFKRYISNLKEIVQQMLLCDEYRGKSEEECARYYYNGFYSSPELRDRFPYQLKPCPAKMRNKLISFPTKDQQHMDNVFPERHSDLCDPNPDKLKENIRIQTDDVEVNSSEIPVQTEECLPPNQTSNNTQQTAETLGQQSRNTSSHISKQKTIRTLKDGASFEFPVSFETFKRHINYEEIVKSLLKEDVQNVTEQRSRGKVLFRYFFCSFYVQKDFRQRYPYRFQKADKELLKKLEEYAVPLNDKARQTMSVEAQGKAPQNEGNENEGIMVPSSSKDETLVTISGITYRFPVTFETFHKYINYEELKEGLANGPGPKKKSPEELADILGDEKSCLRLLRGYYHSFYTKKNIRNKLNYNFNAAPPELCDKLLEWAKSLEKSTEAAQIVPQTQLQVQPNPGNPTAPDHGPVQHIEDVSPEGNFEPFKPLCSSSQKKNNNILITETDEVEVDLSEIPFQTEEFLPQNQTSNNSQQTVAIIEKKSSKTPSNVSQQRTFKTLKSGASFEFPVSFEIFKQHINYDEIVKSLLLQDVPNETEPSTRGKRLFRNFFCSFYAQKDFRQGHPCRFQKADKELLKKLEGYAVPLNDIAKQTMSDQAQGKAPQNEGKEDESWTVPSSSKDETLVTISGITYRFPVSFKTFHKYINYEELKEGLANGPGPKKKSPEELADILGDEKSCLRLLRCYYHSFYTKKNIRNKLNYNFLAAPPELCDKLFELAKPIVESTKPAQSLSQTLPKGQAKQGSANGPTKAPVPLNVFLNYMQLDDVVAGMQQESEYCTMTEDECKQQYYQAFYTDVSIRDKYPFKLKPCSAEIRERLLMFFPPSDHTYHLLYRDLDEINATRERELATPRNLRLYIAPLISVPKKRALLERHILDLITTKQNATGKWKEETTARKETAARGKDSATREDDTSPREKDNGMREGTTGEGTTREETTREETTGGGTTREETTRGKTTREGTTREGATREEATREGTTREEAIREEAAAREPTTSEGKTAASKEATTTGKEETTTKKNIEAETTNKTQPVSNKVTEKNSPKANESQKSSELESVSEKIYKTTSKENYSKNATTKPPEEATRNVSPSASTKKPSDLPASTTNIEPTKQLQETQNKDETSQDGTGTRDSTAASKVSHQPTERQIILDQARKVFFAEGSQDHNMAYLICTSQGLKRAIWRVLYQLSLEEFKTYTSIHNGENLYRNDADLLPYYQHVVDKGNWPINLYVRLPLLRQLLYSKGVELGRMDLGQLSPKILHWREADENTNFDQIVEEQFKDRTGEEIDSVEQWFDEREQFYAACWLHDQWLYEVPQITNEALHDESYIKDLPLPDLNGVVLKSLPIARSEDVSSQTGIISIASSSDMVPDSQSCPSTQLNHTSNLADITTMMDIHSSSQLQNPNGMVFFSSESLSNAEREAGCSQTENMSKASSSDMVPDSQSCPPTQLSYTPTTFVDIAGVETHSQVPETPLDPLATQAETLSAVKHEPIKFLNNLRGVCNSNGCQWEQIGSEDQIVNLDSSQEEGPSLSCFAIQKPTETISPYQSLDSLLTATMFEDDSIVVEEEAQSKESDNIGDVNVNQQPEDPAVGPVPCPEVPELNVIQQPEEPAPEVNVIQSQALTLPQLPELRKKKIPASNAAATSKRARLANDKVPQLRHEFRPLPMGAGVRIETEVLATDKSPTEPPPTIATPQPQEVPSSSNMTPSQEFAQGNTLLESSQLAAFLDALPPGLNLCKVNENEQVNGNLAKVTVPEPTLCQIGIFRKLERFHFFASLTVRHIIRHRIEYMPGARYQGALLKIDGKLSQVRGPMLNALFPHLSPGLRSDLERVLLDMAEFEYSCRWWRVLKDPTQDLRKRVLFTFFDLAPEFGQFRLHFETASREWATCSEIGRWDPTERTEQRPRSLEKVISPGILDKMRELKEMCSTL